jgi:broad specificity phosphatase PhoE
VAELWLIRHGETAWSAERRHTGRTDIPLTVSGEREARALGLVLEGHAFARVLTSPLSRARKTCELAGLGELARVDGDLSEWDYGAYEGRTTTDIRQSRPGWRLWRDGPSEGESLASVGERADRVLARVTDISGDVALFSHAHLLRVLTARWLGLGAEAGRLFALGTATLSVLGYEHEERVITLWNNPGPGPLGR